jgi:hypothetical protein
MVLAIFLYAVEKECTALPKAHYANCLSPTSYIHTNRKLRCVAIGNTTRHRRYLQAGAIAKDIIGRQAGLG